MQMTIPNNLTIVKIDLDKVPFHLLKVYCSLEDILSFHSSNCIFEDSCSQSITAFSIRLD